MGRQADRIFRTCSDPVLLLWRSKKRAKTKKKPNRCEIFCPCRPLRQLSKLFESTLQFLVFRLLLKLLSKQPCRGRPIRHAMRRENQTLVLLQGSRAGRGGQSRCVRYTYIMFVCVFVCVCVCVCVVCVCVCVWTHKRAYKRDLHTLDPF